MSARILFLCTGNSCRSQMAEGWARHLLSKKYEAYSAGTDPHPLNQLAVEAMNEVGIDISKHFSKSLDSLTDLVFDLVVTVCDNAANSCPIPPNAKKVIHVPFEDPPKLAINSKNHEEAMTHYRRVRDEIRDFITSLALLPNPQKKL